MSALAIGLGLKRGASAQAIVDLVRRAWDRADDATSPAALYTVAGKETERALYEAAAVLGLPLAFLPREALASVAHLTVTPSPAAEARFGLPSYRHILKWADAVRPRNLSASERDRYLAQAATPGGVTEAIVKAIADGLPLPDALVRGIERSVELARL